MTILSAETYRGALGALAAEVASTAQLEGIECLPIDGFDPMAFLPGAPTRANCSRGTPYRVLESIQQSRTGVWRDLAVHHRQTEVDCILFPIVEFAARHKRELPRLARLIALVKELELGTRPSRVAQPRRTRLSRRTGRQQHACHHARLVGPIDPIVRRALLDHQVPASKRHLAISDDQYDLTGQHGKIVERLRRMKSRRCARQEGDYPEDAPSWRRLEAPLAGCGVCFTSQVGGRRVGGPKPRSPA